MQCVQTQIYRLNLCLAAPSTTPNRITAMLREHYIVYFLSPVPGASTVSGAIPRLDERFECHAGAYRCQIKVEYHRDPLRALCLSVYFLVSDVQSLDYSVHAARLRRRKIVYYQKRIPTCRCQFFTCLLCPCPPFLLSLCYHHTADGMTVGIPTSKTCKRWLFFRITTITQTILRFQFIDKTSQVLKAYGGTDNSSSSDISAVRHL